MVHRRKGSNSLCITGCGVPERKPEIPEATTAVIVDTAEVYRLNPAPALIILWSPVGSLCGTHTRQLQLELRGSVIFC